MASKIVVMKNGEFQAQSSAERLENELASLRGQLVEVVGVRQNNDGVEFPAQDYAVEPAIKKSIVNHLKYLQGVFMADKKESNTGRAPKADQVVLRQIYVSYMRNHRTQNKNLAAMNIAMEYNNGRPENEHIDNGYVVRNAKSGGWDSLIDVPEPATA